MNTHRAALLTARCLALAVGMSLVAAPARAAGDGYEVRLDFDDVTAARQSGTSSATVRTLVADGGSVEQVAGFGGGQAVRLPAYSSGSTPKAAFSLVDTEGADDLDPGSADFTFGADFALDAVSSGSAGDNGNNLVQRGLYHHPGQMKIQSDAGRLSCRVKGTRGDVLVRSPATVSPNVWYRTWCRRTGSTVTLKLIRLSDRATWTRSATATLGSVDFATSTPFSSGGKLASATTFTGGSTDQFNGRVDRVVLDVR